MKKRFLVGVLCLLWIVTGIAAQDTAVVPSEVATVESPGGGATAPIIWVHPDDSALSLILGTDDNAGLGVYDLDGTLLQTLEDDGGIKNADVRYNVAHGNDMISLIAGGVDAQPQVIFYTVNAESREVVRLGNLEVGVDHNGLCLYRSPINSTLYVFVVSEDGDVEQYALSSDGTTITGELARDFSVGGEVEGCVADDENGALYLGEEEIGIWKYGGEPEEGVSRTLVDFGMPFNASGIGNFAEQVEGLTLYYGVEGTGYLIAADESGSRFNVYERDGNNAYVGSFTLEGLSEPGGIDVVANPVGDYEDGLFVTLDDEGGNFKLAQWEDIADALELRADNSYDVRTIGMANPDLKAVMSTIETEAVPSGTDAADDPAVWIHPTDTALSTIIGTDKTAGLAVYNLDGSLHQVVNIGRINNVDLRYNFPLGDAAVAIVGSTNRDKNSLELYAVNVETRDIYDVAAREIVSDMAEVYGFCMYHSASSGTYYAIINSSDTGEVEQYALSATTDGKVDAELVREFVVGSQTEGCVADDETGFLYIGEEGEGIWKYGAEPDAGEDRVMVDSTSDAGNLTADVEGLTIYYAADGAGYLIASSQGSSEFVVYDRAGDNAYLGTFSIILSDSIDGVSGTDGIDVTNFGLGDAFPQGVFIVQDDLNINPDENQNFKLVAWESVAALFDLTVDTTFDPRLIGAQ